MVKNAQGGNGHKKFARKHAFAGNKDARLVVATDPLALYAVATKILGGRQFYCMCSDGVTRRGHIRGKFAGRGKRGNIVALGTWVLVGRRDWMVPSSEPAAALTAASTSTKRMEECDLMEVYSDADRLRLQDAQPRVNWRVLNEALGAAAGSGRAEEDAIFATDADLAREELLVMVDSAKNKEVIRLQTTEEDGDVDVDDI